MAKKILANVFIWLVLVFMYLPIGLLIILSFTESKAFGDWSGFSLQLYIDLFDPSKSAAIHTAVGNTVLVGTISSFIATLVGTVSAVGIAALKKMPKSIVNAASQITVLNADIVTAAALLLFFVTLNIPTGYGTLILAHVIITTPYVVLSVLPRLSQLNPNLFEAALDLGASPTRALFKVMVPQLVPGMLSGFVLAFTLSIDDFVVSNYTNGNIDTISTFIYKDASRAGITPSLRALSTIMFVVVLAVLITINIVSTRRAKRLSKMGGAA